MLDVVFDLGCIRMRQPGAAFGVGAATQNHCTPPAAGTILTRIPPMG
jgi:hypothetical protein